MAQPEWDWQRLYEEAIAETDQETCIAAAEAVLTARLQQEHLHRDELTAIYDAIHALRLLRCNLYSRRKQDVLMAMFQG